MKIDLKTIKKYVINLPKREDRLITFKSELGRIIPNSDFIVSEGVIDKIPRIGIANAHINVIKKAKELNLDYVLIMEDDLLATSDNSASYAERAFSDCPDDCDILLGGIYTTAKLIHYNEYWQQTHEFSGTHFYIIFKKAYDKVINDYDSNCHIDRWFANHKKGNLKCYVTKEFFAIQKDGYSDNTKKETNYNKTILNKFKLLK